MEQLGKAAGHTTTTTTTNTIVNTLGTSIIGHEHDFVSEENTCFVLCLTCNMFFCRLCGRELKNPIDSIFHVRRCDC